MGYQKKIAFFAACLLHLLSLLLDPLRLLFFFRGPPRTIMPVNHHFTRLPPKKSPWFLFLPVCSHRSAWEDAWDSSPCMQHLTPPPNRKAALMLGLDEEVRPFEKLKVSKSSQGGDCIVLQQHLLFYELWSFLSNTPPKKNIYQSLLHVSCELKANVTGAKLTFLLLTTGYTRGIFQCGICECHRRLRWQCNCVCRGGFPPPPPLVTQFPGPREEVKMGCGSRPKESHHFMSSWQNTQKNCFCQVPACRPPRRRRHPSVLSSDKHPATGVENSLCQCNSTSVGSFG